MAKKLASRKTSHASRFPLRKRMFTVFLVLSLSANIIFLRENYERNRVVRVPDGDSLQLSDGRRVRLLGINAPEVSPKDGDGKGNCIAEEAHRNLSELALGKHVRLKNTVTDDYGRILANVIVEDFSTWIGYMRFRFMPNLIQHISLSLSFSENNVATRLPDGQVQQSNHNFPDPYLNRAMVGLGLAKFTYISSPYTEVLSSAQEVAKSSKLGIWSDGCRGSTPPKKECAIKGNIRNTEKAYHLPKCDNYDQVIVDTAYGDRWFCSETEAKSAGFAKSGSCR